MSPVFIDFKSYFYKLKSCIHNILIFLKIFTFKLKFIFCGGMEQKIPYIPLIKIKNKNCIPFLNSSTKFFIWEKILKNISHKVCFYEMFCEQASRMFLNFKKEVAGL